MKTSLSLARRLFVMIVMGALVSSCSIMDIRHAGKQDWITQAVPAVSADRSTPSRKRPPPEPAPREDGPAAFRHLLNIIRAPFIPIGVAAEIIGAGLEGTVGRTVS